jgi:hypothetical protein
MLPRNVGSCVPVYVVFYPRLNKSVYIKMFILFEIKINNAEVPISVAAQC